LQNNNLVTGQTSDTAIVFLKAEAYDSLGVEGYKLNISTKKITVRANHLQGALHAVFSILQLRLLQPDKLKIPCTDIVDYPRFTYRGMHLDVSRNFFPVSFIKKYIDIMAMYKFNTFHWHLTDGPG